MSEGRILPERDGAIIESIMAVLDSGTSSKFRYEGACRAGLRKMFILLGQGWHHADARACLIVAEALRLIGAVRPTWWQAQATATDEGRSYTEYYYCQTCAKPIEPLADWHPSTKKYCSEACLASASLRRIQIEGRQYSRAEYLAEIAARTAQRKQERIKACKHCERLFVPDRRIADEQEYCSYACSREGLRLKPKPCAHCQQPFTPKLSTRQYCSLSCANYAIQERRRKRQDDYIKNALPESTPGGE